MTYTKVAVRFTERKNECMKYEKVDEREKLLCVKEEIRMSE